MQVSRRRFLLAAAEAPATADMHCWNADQWSLEGSVATLKCNGRDYFTCKTNTVWSSNNVVENLSNSRKMAAFRLAADS
jgi:hypothetical protein